MLITLNERYFVLNPFEGTLIRYKHEKFHPFKPIEIMPLKDIQNIRTISPSWFMKSELFYFEIILNQ